eukprot:11157613-Lingulodinium_polyedra.AAC.1
MQSRHQEALQFEQLAIETTLHPRQLKTLVCPNACFANPDLEDELKDENVSVGDSLLNLPVV